METSHDPTVSGQARQRMLRAVMHCALLLGGWCARGGPVQLRRWDRDSEDGQLLVLPRPRQGQPSTKRETAHW